MFVQVLDLQLHFLLWRQKKRFDKLATLLSGTACLHKYLAGHMAATRNLGMQTWSTEPAKFKPQYQNGGEKNDLK